jgi:hypothetical protein
MLYLDLSAAGGIASASVPHRKSNYLRCRAILRFVCFGLSGGVYNPSQSVGRLP